MATHDNEAERALIGACLLSDVAIEAAQPIVATADFHTPRHQAIWDAIEAAHAAGEPADTIGIHRRIATADVPLEYLHELQNATYSTSSAARYAHLIVEARVRYRLVQAGAEIVALGNGTAPSDTAGDAVDRARTIVADIDMPAGDSGPDPDIDTWLSGVDQSYDWLFPDFLERGDRLLVTSSEGAGKSLLNAQIGFQGAAGIHPWTHRPTTPFPVLIVDLENGDKLLGRRYAALRRKVPATFDPTLLRFHGRPAGIDLTSNTGRRWLIDRIAANRPALLVIGPAYKMTRGEASKTDVGGEERAKATVDVLNDIRARFGCALILETHAPHGYAGSRDLRPFGSSVWLRWPEFGIGFTPSKDDKTLHRGHPRLWTLSHWRGPRDVRRWPLTLERGGFWPWTAVMPTGSYTDEAPPINAYDDDHLFGGPDGGT